MLSAAALTRTGARSRIANPPCFLRADPILSFRHHAGYVVREFGDVLDSEVEVRRDERRRCVGEPVGQRYVLVGVGLEDFEEDQIRVANVLDLMAKVGLDVADVARLEVIRHRVRAGVEDRHLG